MRGILFFILINLFSCSIINNPSEGGTHIPNLIRGKVISNSDCEVYLYKEENITSPLVYIAHQSTQNRKYEFEVEDTSFYLIKIDNKKKGNFILQKPSPIEKEVILNNKLKVSFSIKENSFILIDSTDYYLNKDTTIYLPQKGYNFFIYQKYNNIPVLLHRKFINIQNDTFLDFSYITTKEPIVNDSFSVFNYNIWKKRVYTWDENLAAMDSDQVFIKNGELVIATQKKSLQGKEYVSGGIETIFDLSDECVVWGEIKLDTNKGVFTQIDFLYTGDYDSKISINIGDDKEKVFFNYDYDDFFLEKVEKCLPINQYFTFTLIKNSRFIELYINDKFIGSFEYLGFYKNFKFRINRYIPTSSWSSKYINPSLFEPGNMYIKHIIIFN